MSSRLASSGNPSIIDLASAFGLLIKSPSANSNVNATTRPNYRNLVALSRALQRVGCSSGLCRSLKMIFPSREDQHGGMALEGSREHLCALHTQANTVVLDRGKSSLWNARAL